MTDLTTLEREGRAGFGFQAQTAARRLAGAEPQGILQWAFETFDATRVAISTSLQREGLVLVDMAWRITPDVQVFTIDTGRLPPETLELMDRVRERYGITLEVLYPDAAELSSLTSRHGVNLFYRSPELRLACCDVRKVRPLVRRLAGLDCWVSGLRRSRSQSRASVAQIEIDDLHGGIIKLNPLALWSEDQVEDYARQHQVPSHPLYERGYASIGCAPCTRPIKPGEDPRAGRWWWENGAAECGIHYELAVGPDDVPRTVIRRRPLDSSPTDEEENGTN